MKGYIIYARIPDDEAEEFEKQLKADERLEQVFSRDETEEDCDNTYWTLTHEI